MDFFSFSFFIFLIVSLMIYYLLPGRYRPHFLCLDGLFFYFTCSKLCTVLLLFIVVLSFSAAQIISLARSEKVRKLMFFASCASVILVLFFFKYTNMLLDTISELRALFGARPSEHIFSVILPLGISFYIFQAIGYLADVYRGTILAEKNLFHYGSFLLFFPKLISGPLEKTTAFLPQIKNLQHIKPKQENLSKGISQMLYGYFEKMVIADCLSHVVNIVYSDHQSFGGCFLLLATILFGIQIYCDFDGYTNIAIGIARLFGITLHRNFNTPYFADSISDFWRRWHISLSTWLKDYIYIPLGGNRHGTYKKYRNLLITFLVSGLWHGANWTFVIWGGLHGIYQIIGDHFKRPSFDKKWYKIFIILRTFLLVDFAWLFFKADSLSDAMTMINRIIFHLDPLELLSREQVIRLGLTINEWIVLLFAVLILFALDLYKYHLDQKYSISLEIYDKIYELPAVVKTLLFFTAILFILIFGSYGPEFNATQFIYTQF